MRAHVSRTFITRAGTTRAGKSAVLAAAVIAVAALGTAAPAHADATLVVTTPYPSIEAQPGADVKLSLTVVSATPDVVNLDVGGLPDGWTATLRGGGFVIHSITSKPDTGATADLEIAVPPGASWRVPHYRHRPGRVGRAVRIRRESSSPTSSTTGSV